MAQTADLLAAEEDERHRRVVLVIDEAHLLDPAQLEELRLLTNAEMDSASPFAGILVLPAVFDEDGGDRLYEDVHAVTTYDINDLDRKYIQAGWSIALGHTRW